MPTTPVNGIDLYHEDHGSGEPFLLLHGFAGTTDMWRPQVTPFSQGRRFITYDMRGHGQSSAPDSVRDYSLDIVVEDQRQLLDRLGVDRAIIGGLSLGGYVSIGFYFRHPEMVKAMVLADTGPGYRNPKGGMEQWNRTRVEAAEVLFKEGMAGYRQSAYAASNYYSTPEVMDRHRPHGLANVALGVMIGPVMPPLEEIKVPTLIICGENDTPFRAATDYMESRIPGSEKIIIPGAGHGANLDDPAAFNEGVLGFFERNGL